MKFEKVKGSQNHHLFHPVGADGKVRDVFWVRFFRAGKGRLEESLKTDLLGDARLARDRRIADFLGEKPRFASKVFLIEEKFPEFLELKKGKARKTQVSMNLQWEKHLKPHFGGLLLDEVTESEWLKYVQVKRKEAPGRKFFNDRKYLRMFLNWCLRDGLISKIPKFEDVDPERAAGKVFSPAECARMLAAAGPDLRLMILMALTMFMRKSEILTLEWAQVDLQKRIVHLPAHKTKIRKERRFAIAEEVVGILASRKAASTSPFVFPQVTDPTKHVHTDGSIPGWDDCRELAGVTGRFHDLRHTALTTAFRRNADKAALICTFAGVSLEEAQRTYLHFDTEDTRVVASLVEV